MGRYLISYDLRNKRDYEDLYEAIKSYLKHTQVLESVWAVKSEKTASEIRDSLKQFIDNDDGLFVSSCPEGAAWTVINCSKEELANCL